MPSVQRQGDPNTVGGIARVGVASVRANGRPIITNGSPVSAHTCCGQRGCPGTHCGGVTTGGSGTVRAGGKPVVYTGSSDSCGHTRSGGSGDVRVGA